jgi:hypothetical protein
MGRRLNLHEEFCTLLGTRNVYYDPPESVLMNYDAIRYKLGGKDIRRANDVAYQITDQYEGVVISDNPDCEVPDVILRHFSMCSFGRPYVADNLYHFPFTLYY